MLDTIKFLLSQGIALVLEGRDQRKIFFTEIAQPIHSNFTLLKKDHASTFQFVLRALAEPNPNLPAIYTEVALRNSFESNQWEFIYQFSHYEIPRRELHYEFNDYMHSLCECLGTIFPRPSLIYYDSLLKVLKFSPFARTEDGTVEANPVERMTKQVKSLQASFNGYCASVDAKFLVLKSKALL